MLLASGMRNALIALLSFLAFTEAFQATLLPRSTAARMMMSHMATLQDVRFFLFVLRV
jgi:hypothetical protein